jgi:adenosylcobinamide-GDP ribazoletransferase
MVAVAWSSSYARSEGGLAASFLVHLSFHHVLLSSLVLAVALAIGLGLPATIATMGIGLGLVALVRGGCRKWFGGVTGDLLGATNELIEILFLLLVPILVIGR